MKQRGSRPADTYGAPNCIHQQVVYKVSAYHKLISQRDHLKGKGKSLRRTLQILAN
jgi:hypothetical protein